MKRLGQIQEYQIQKSKNQKKHIKPTYNLGTATDTRGFAQLFARLGECGSTPSLTMFGRFWKGKLTDGSLPSNTLGKP